MQHVSRVGQASPHVCTVPVLVRIWRRTSVQRIEGIVHCEMKELIEPGQIICDVVYHFLNQCLVRSGTK